MREITKEIRKTIICDNIGSEIVRFKTEGGILNISNLAYIENFDLWEQISIIKTPIDKINNEDALHIHSLVFDTEKDIEIAISFGKELAKHILDEQEHEMNLTNSELIKIYQHLKNKNYALPYLDYSVAELFESNIYKEK